MDGDTATYFVELIQQATNLFTEVEFETDVTPYRAIVRLQAQYGPFRVFITELVAVKGRQYRYYVLRDNWVEAGFDNAPDPRAIRLKYGHIGSDHAREPVPHLHRQNKTQLELTQEMTFTGFLIWLQTNLVI
ncbi:MAG: hypothetical protein R6X34_25755 [Chloroflexota bacterium]